MNLNDGQLPYVDKHAITIAAPRDDVWSALHRYAGASLCSTRAKPLAWVLGTEPHAGFEVRQTVPPRLLGLSGRHRFARYQLVFELCEASDGGTVLSARTYAAFGGLHGRMYRAMVLGSRLHVLATRRVLRGIARHIRPHGTP